MKKILIILIIIILILVGNSIGLFSAEAVEKTPTNVFNISNINDIGSSISVYGYFWTFAAVFIAGILLSFTPCVFPMIPITLAVIGIKGIGNPAKGFILSLFYVIGIAVTYSVLGFIAATTGAAFGAAMQSPILLWVVVILFFTLSLSMFGLFELQIPSSIASKFGRVGERKGRGLINAFLLGIVAGIVASPCISPVIAGLLTYVARTGNQLLGISLFFTLALGLGVLFIVLGTFPGLLTSLPKPGSWLVEIKKFLGLLLLGATFYFLKLLISYKLYLLTLSITLSFLGVFTGAFYKVDHTASPFIKIRKALGLIFIVAGAAILFSLTFTIVESGNRLVTSGLSDIQSKKAVEEIKWIYSEQEGLKLAKEQNKPVILDFYADWCIACKELDKITYTNKEVIKESQRFIMIKVNCTKDNEEIKKIQRKYSIRGYPTIVFINSTGISEQKIKQIGFITPDKFLEIMKKIK